MTKMTSAVALATVSDILSTLTLEQMNLDEKTYTALTDKLSAMSLALANRKSRPRKPSQNKAALANDIIRADILDVLTTDKPMTIEEICAAVPACADKSTHAMAALMGKLCKMDAVERMRSKGKVLYFLPPEE